jgi:Zn-dependent protease
MESGFSLLNVRFAAYLLIGMVPSLLLHEYAHAITSVRLGDRSPQLYGRLNFFGLRNPHFFDPFGTGVLPAILLFAVTAGLAVPPFAYAKPMPRNPGTLRNPVRDTNLIALAGPLANLLLAFVAGFALRFVGATELGLFVYAVLLVNATFTIFYLIPIPGLDGAIVVGSFLSGRAKEVYKGLDQYLPLFMLLVIFLIGGPVTRWVTGIAGAICELASGVQCFGI